MGKRFLFTVILASFFVAVAVPTPSTILSEGATITVSRSVIGKTTQYIGATEGGSFSVSDLTDCGISTYRIWIGMSDVEYCDDDDPRGYNWGCEQAGNSQYGLPTIAEIKANPEVIDWNIWDDHINNVIYRWRTNYEPDTVYGDMIADLADSSVLPVLCLRNRDEYDFPDWAPEPPFDEDAVNEWWQYCFAVAYWFNVRNRYGVTHFEIHNEPDLASQGWHGNQAQYVELVQIAYDAIKTANDIAGLDTVLMASVESQCPFPRTYNYFQTVFDGADAEIHVADFHWYHMNATYPLSDLELAIDDVMNQITDHNPDGMIEPLWVSEYGNFSSCAYDTTDEALRTARQLLIFSRKEVQGVNIFPFYDWGGTCGLVDASGGKTETYYAYRLMLRALAGGKDRLSFAANGIGDDVIVTRDPEHIYILVLDGDGTINVDLSALGVDSGTATIQEYSSSHKDEITGTSPISRGQFSFSAASTGIALATIPFTITYVPLISKGYQS